MTPLFLIPLGVYAIIATIGTGAADRSSTNDLRDGDIEVAMGELRIAPPSAPKGEIAKDANPTAVLTAGIGDPLVQAAFVKSLEAKFKSEGHQIAPRSEPARSANDDNPGQYFLISSKDDDAGYSAPLGLTDDSHNDWMK